MPTHDYECSTCGKRFEAVVDWRTTSLGCGSCGGIADRIYVGAGANVLDDTIPGGPRWMHNLGDHPVWVETKTQLRAEMQARGLVFADRTSYNRQDTSPWATKTRLRPGARDPFLQRADE